MAHATGRPPTIIDIAHSTGLSKSVVSRALNGESGVSRDSRERVEAAALELGYVANAMARKMRSQQADMIGVLVRDPASVFYGALLGALQSYASDLGVRLITMTGSGRPDLEEERTALRSLLTLRVDGLLVCSGLLPASDLYPFAERVPTVVVGRSEWDLRIGSVSCDDEDGARQIVDHVTSLGRSELLIPLVPASIAPALHVRGNLLASYAQSCGVHATTLAAETPEHLLSKLPTRFDARTAILAPNDRWALALRETLTDQPQLLVTGYDGLGVYASPLLGLTTLTQPIDAIARSALMLVNEILTDGRAPEHLALRGTLRTPEANA